MKIAFIALWSPTSRKYWSGTPYYSYEAIKNATADTVLIDTPKFDKILFYIGKLTRRFGLDLLREPIVKFVYSKFIQRRISEVKPDVIVSVGASHKLCDIETDAPIFHVADALFATILESYGSMSGMCSRSRRLGDLIQRRFLGKVDRLFLSSYWAVDSACRHYDLSGTFVTVLPLGANLEYDPGFDMQRRKENRNLSLLFVGGDWERKGGPLLLNIFNSLRAQVPDAHLHIVGCNPNIGATKAVTVHGVLRKSVADEAEKLVSLYRDSAFLLVPSREEAFGIVFCEACAFGLPPIGTETGGVGTIIVDGENGFLMPLDATCEQYVRRILDLWHDPDEYMKMCVTSRHHYEERLSWSAWANSILLAAEDVGSKR